MKRQTWIVVADEAYARVFQLEKNRSLKELETLVHPESRLHERDLVSDRPGRTFESHAMSRRSLGQTVPPKRQEALNFAKLVSDYLDTAAQNGVIEKIYLAASPAFLGLLRQSLSKMTAQMIVTEINKEITHLEPSEISTFFPFAHT